MASVELKAKIDEWLKWDKVRNQFFKFFSKASSTYLNFKSK